MKFSFDGFKNILKGLGGNKDARSSRIYAEGMYITQQMADDLYTFNWLAKKCVNIPIDDATRKWRNLIIPDPEKKKEIEQVYKDHDIKGRINTAMKWARVFGGSAMIMVVEGDQTEPLNIDNIRPGSLKNIVVLDRYNIEPHEIDRNVLSPNFGKPTFYSVVREGELIHHSRVIKFVGDTPTIYQEERNNYWGLSVFSDLFETIGDSQEVSGAIATMVSESNIDVYKIAGFNELVATDEELATKRITIAHQMKSIVNGIVLDQADDYDKKSNTFASLPDIDDRAIQKVAGASNIPVTRLLGTSPSGQNATGESDMRNYYDSVQSLQENDIRPKLDIIDKIVLGSAGYSDEFDYVFNPLQQMSEQEQADVDLKKGQRDQIYLDQDVITHTDVIKQLAEDGTYVAIDADRVEVEEIEEELTFEDPEESNPSEELEGAGEEISKGTGKTGEGINQSS